jgi:hypothetical protein
MRRLPTVEKYRVEAERWRRLAAEATTPLVRDQLLARAREFETIVGTLRLARRANRARPPSPMS